MAQGQEVVGVGPPVIVVVVGGPVMPLALRGGLAAVGHRPDEVDDGRRKPSKVRYIWVVQYGLSTGQKTFFSAAATSSNHTFYSFRRFLNFLRTVFKYGLWCMVSRGGSMDQSLGGIFRPKQSSEK